MLIDPTDRINLDRQLTGRRALDPAEVAILDSFRHHVPSPERGQRMTDVRARFESLAGYLIDVVRPGADRTAALRKLHEAMMTANKAIVLEPDSDSTPAG